MNLNSITLSGSKESFIDEVDTRLKFIKKYNSYFSIFKIFLTSYSSAMLNNSFISKRNKEEDIKSNLYIFFLNLFVKFRKYIKH